MDVKVLAITKNHGEIHTLCETEFGTVTLLWRGEAPRLNEIYGVELETSQILEWNVTILCSDENLAIYDEPDGIAMIGDLDSIDPDGYMTVRQGNCLTAFMTKGTPAPKGTRIRLKLNALAAYPWMQQPFE